MITVFEMMTTDWRSEDNKMMVITHISMLCILAWDCVFVVFGSSVKTK